MSSAEEPRGYIVRNLGIDQAATGSQPITTGA